jgi:DEAD/DEAH box helicase domain-containing protein
MDARGFIERLRAGRDYRGQVAAVRWRAARPAEHRAPANPIPDRLQALLRNEGIDRLYAHQAEAYDAARGGQDVVICTPTASGKSLGFHLPVLAELLEDPERRALYLFPAKALAYDQLGNLERMVTEAGLQNAVRPACYDGDTPPHRRAGIRRNATLLLSNPDMLHVSILPNHAKWAGLFARLAYVVLDEIHTYRGIFGSHVAGVLRRLQRICRHYGSAPRFICCSATLGNPRELAERLVNRPMRLIDRDGSPQGRKCFVLWNPPWLAETRVARRSGNIEAQELMARLLEAGAGTITFAKARVVAELIYKYLAEVLERRQPGLSRRVRPYRGGYLPNERRGIEAALFSGELLGVCSTNALELGIDVGALDAAIIVGFPGTLCSLWQQAGRAGRRQGESLAVFVAYDDPIDQYLMRHPDFVFGRPVEHGIIDPDNPHILKSQLGCAAYELPLEKRDFAQFGDVAAEVAELTAEAGELRWTADKYYWASSETPAQRTSIRQVSNATYAIVDITDGRDTVLGQVDSISAPELVYPEAVYLHAGASYVVRELDQQAQLARVERWDADYYTQPLLHSEIRVVRKQLEAEFLSGQRGYGDATVQWQTVGFRKFKFYTMELIGQRELELAPLRIDTTTLWLQPPLGVLKAVADAGFQKHEALAGVRNLLLVALPPLAMADRRDIGGIVDSSQLGRPTIFLYDRYEGGVGYARHGYECAGDLLRMAYELVSGCDCDDGCPGCVGPANLRPPLHHDPDIYRAYEFPDKRATMRLLGNWQAM